MKSTHSLSTRLSRKITGRSALQLLGIVIILGLLSSLFIYQSVVRGSKLLLQNGLSEIQCMLEDVESSTNSFAATLDKFSGSKEDLLAFAERVVVKDTNIIACNVGFAPYFFDKREKYFCPFAAISNDGTVFSKILGGSNYDYFLSDWYLIPKLLGKGYWTDPSFDSEGTGKMITSYASPIYQDGKHGEEALLESCYQRSLELAVSHGCRSVAFPLISGGVYGYPKAEALAVGVRTVRAYLAAQEEEIEVYFVFLRKDDFQLTDSDFSEIDRYIGRNYEPEKIGLKARKNATAKHGRSSIHANALGMIFSTKDSDGVFSEKESAGEVFSDKESSDEIFTEACMSFAPMVGEPFVLDESFSEMLLRLIDERGLTDPEVYKAANMSRKLFSKIRSDVHYQPSKKTVAALIIALKLRMEEAEELMMKAGFAFSNSVLFDVIIRYYIGKAQYDLFKINETLFEKDQPLLGQE